ncbi:MAG: NAD(P)(+) transhydrogenase (Re/Si-specific) subunit beta [Myxococcota bacterium]
MEQALLTIAYLAASVFFILSLRGLSSQETARRGNLYGMIGMAIAIIATFTSELVTDYATVGGVMIAGGAVGAVLASRVAMTSMPELVAMLHSFVGLAAVLVGLASYVGEGEHVVGTERSILLVEIFVDVLIGAVTFTGSVIAFGKLRGMISGKPLAIPGRHFLNAAMLGGSFLLLVPFLQAEGTSGMWALLVVTVLASILGIHWVMAIGGADMPVVVSMLNSYSGWTAAAAGFMLGNDLLIVVGALVGSSGAILSIIMCRAMNRSIANVMLGGFGGEGAAPAKRREAGEPGTVQETDVSGTVEALRRAEEVIIVPGYGLAVARAQHAIRDLTRILREQGKKVRFAIHPVAGRLPGHMNVLLAEADVPYDIVLEMDEINEDFPKTDVALVVGANDIVNPAAEDDASSPIYGMPVIRVWQAGRTIMCKRSRASGYAGIDNPLFYHERTRMLFGDARDMMEAVVSELRQG